MADVTARSDPALAPHRWSGHTVRERFDRFAVPTEGCWLWQGARSSAGYGQLRVAGRLHYAHRLAWEFFRGPITDGLRVLHHCDVPACVNPDHLWLGTQADNIQDAARKGRVRYWPRKKEAAA